MKKYLLEIGTEELPYKFISSGLLQLETSFKKLLDENKISYKNITTYGTPRRLTVIIEDLAEKQENVEKILKGPLESIAYDTNKKLTPAGIGFLKKNNANESDIFIKDSYIHLKIEQKGKLSKDILTENIDSLVLKLQGSHFMRWGSSDVKFQRPIRWVVSLIDNEELPISIANVKSSRFSRGHRFSSDNVKISSVDTYLDDLKAEKVIVSQNERRIVLIEKTKEAAKSIGADVVLNDDLVDEVVNLVEYPIPCICDFSEKYLKIPEKVNVTVMATHQRYFPLYKNGKLLNKFITTTNYLGKDFTNVKAGNERVVTARLEDGLFFFEQDSKTPLGNKLESLKGITFQKGLGSMYDKTLRIKKLSEFISNTIPQANVDDILRTAELCKCDLTTKLVFEFTELQGFIGADYAKLSGENTKVSEGIKEHYFPLSADGELAQSLEGQIVGIADKIDTVCAIFSDGRKPTGSADPLGVRRAVLGILKTIIAFNLNIDITKLVEYSISILPKKAENEKELQKDILEFFIQRLTILYTDKYAQDVVSACISNKLSLQNLPDFVNRVDVLDKLVKHSDYAKFHDAINRIIRIIKNEKDFDKVDEILFINIEEKDLYNAFSQIDNDLSYENLVKELLKTTDTIEKFFDKVLVMDKDEKIRNNRINLLNFVKCKFDKIADFSKIIQ